MKRSQRERIREFLLAGNLLNPRDAQERFGCWRLGARIWELREEGLPIRTLTVKTRSGKHFAAYALSSTLGAA